MGRQIILKDDGSIAVWSSVVDDFIFEGSIGEWAKRVARRAYDVEIGIYKDLHVGRKPYHGCEMTYKEACKDRKRVHGK